MESRLSGFELMASNDCKWMKTPSYSEFLGKQFTEYFIYFTVPGVLITYVVGMLILANPAFRA